MSASRSWNVDGSGLAQGLRRFARALGVDIATAEAIGALSDPIRDPAQARIDAYAGVLQASAFRTPPEREGPGAAPARLVTDASDSAGPARPAARTSLQEDEAARARAALAALPREARAALMLVVTEGLRHGEAAQAMRLEPAVFADLLAQAREAFAVEIAKPRGRPRLRLVQ